MRILLISGDAPLQSLQLARAVAAHQSRCELLDLSGEGLLQEASCFDPLKELDQRWPDLRRRLAGWLEFLQLGNPQVHQLPLIPGLDDVLRTLVLLDHFRAVDNDTLVVLLPACGQAQRFLHGLISSPELIQEIYDPLIGRLTQLQDTLSRLEGLLNLRLPDSSGLALPGALLEDLERLRQHLVNPALCELQLAMPAHQAGLMLLAQRIAGFHLSGMQISRLWLQGPISADLLTEMADAWSPTHLLHTQEHEDFGAAAQTWLSQPWLGEQEMFETVEPDSEVVISLLLPGLSKQQLQVQRVGHALNVRHGPLRRSYPLPTSCLDLSPCGARVVGRRLEVRFR
jgi:anion-transporting  ArsA/GET3 family ATPase